MNFIQLKKKTFFGKIITTLPLKKSDVHLWQNRF